MAAPGAPREAAVTARLARMRTWALAVAMGLGGLSGATSAAAPSRTPLQQCLDGCASSRGTDGSTCRLQCREASDSRQTPNRVEWKRTEYKGGSPDPSQPRGTETVVVETSPNGTTVSVGLDASAERRRKRQHPRPDEGTPAQRRRASHGWCAMGCGAWPTAADRLTCRARCQPRTRKTKPAATRRPPSPRKRLRTKAEKTECRRACGVRQSTCFGTCEGLRGSDRGTCRLQCEQASTRCNNACVAPR